MTTIPMTRDNGETLTIEVQDDLLIRVRDASGNQVACGACTEITPALRRGCGSALTPDHTHLIGGKVVLRSAVAQQVLAAIDTMAPIERERHLREDCKCERCRAHVDGRTAYKQTERMRMGSAVIPVTAYYCDSCRRLLDAIGGGEQSELEARASEVPSYEPTHKEDY